MTKDVQSQIDTIKYDCRGLPLEIKKTGTSTYYRKNAGGQRVFKQTGAGVSTYYISYAGGRRLAVVILTTSRPGTTRMMETATSRPLWVTAWAL
jgi:hypothetical protein